MGPRRGNVRVDPRPGMGALGRAHPRPARRSHACQGFTGSARNIAIPQWSAGPGRTDIRRVAQELLRGEDGAHNRAEVAHPRRLLHLYAYLVGGQACQVDSRQGIARRTSSSRPARGQAGAAYMHRLLAKDDPELTELIEQQLGIAVNRAKR
jgi:hypothetical protein